MAIGRPQMEEQIEGFAGAGAVEKTDPFSGPIDLSSIDPNTLRLMMMQANQPTFDDRIVQKRDLTGKPIVDEEGKPVMQQVEGLFTKYQKRLAPYAYQSPKMGIYDLASDLGAAILATPKSGNVYEGIGRGFGNFSARIRANQEANAKANQQIAFQAMNLAMQDEQKAQDYLQRYSLELLKLANDPGDLVTIEFDEMVPSVDEQGEPVLDDDGKPVMVASGVRKQGTFRDNATNKSVINDLLKNRNGIQIKSPNTVINQSEAGDKEYTKAMIANENTITEESRAASGVIDQVKYARMVAERIGESGYGPQEAFLLPIKKILVGVGLDGMIDSSRVGDQILMNQLGIGFAMAIVGQTKGAISNREMEMFLAASPVLTSTYNGFMKQLDYLERIAKRSEDYAIAYSEEADRLEGLKFSKAKQKRGLDRFAATWQRKNPIFEPEEFETLSGVARGEAEAINKLGVGGAGAGIAEGFDVSDSIQQYKQIQAAKEITGGTSKAKVNINTSSENLAEQISKDTSMDFEAKKEKLQRMLDGGLAVPDYLIQNFGLTK
jgi:hypothetical protein